MKRTVPKLNAFGPVLTRGLKSWGLILSLKRFATFALLSSVLVLTGCEKKAVYNDDYEMPGEPDVLLRNLLGVRTLRSTFVMPEGMRRFRTGLIFVEKGQVTGSNGWIWGDGLHTSHANGKREYAKTVHVEYMNRFDGEEWSGLHCWWWTFLPFPKRKPRIHMHFRPMQS